MLEKLHARDHVELARVLRCVFLGARVLVDHIGLALQEMQLGDAQRFLGQVDAGHPRAARRHRLGEDAAAAADIEDALARKCRSLVDPAEAQRIDVVQRPEFAVWIPPPVRELAELLELCRIGVHAAIVPKKSPAEAGLS